MRGDLVYEKLGEIDEDLIADALPDAVPLYRLGGDDPPPPKKRPNLRKALVACACILLAGILLVGGGVVLSRVKDLSADHPSHETETPRIDPTVNGTNGVSEPETVPEPAPDPESQPFSFGYELTAPSTVSGGDTVEIILSLTNNGVGFSYYGCASDYAPKAKLIAAVAGETVILEVEHATTSDAAMDHWIDTGDTGKGHIYVTIPSDEYLHGASFDLVLTYKDHSRVFRDVLTVDTPPSETYGGEVEVFAVDAENEKLLDVSLTENEKQQQIGDALVSVFNTNSPVLQEEYEDVIANVRFRVGGSVLWYNTNSGYLTDRAHRIQYRLTHIQMTTVNRHLESLWDTYGYYETPHPDHRFTGTVDKMAYQKEDIYTNHDLEMRMYARRVTTLLNTATPVEDRIDNYSAYGFTFDEIHWSYHAYVDRPYIRTIDHRAEDNCLELDPDANVELKCIMETVFKDDIVPACGFSYEPTTILRRSACEAIVYYDYSLYQMVRLALRHKETGYEIPKSDYTYYSDVFTIPEDAPFGEYELVAYLWGELGSGVFRSNTTAVTVVPESKPIGYTFSYKILKRKLTYKAGDTLMVEIRMTNEGDTITRFGNGVTVPKARLVNVKDGREIVIELKNQNIIGDGFLIRTLEGGKTIHSDQYFEIPEGVEGGVYDLVLYFEEHERVFKNAVILSGS